MTTTSCDDDTAGTCEGGCGRAEEGTAHHPWMPTPMRLCRDCASMLGLYLVLKPQAVKGAA